MPKPAKPNPKVKSAAAVKKPTIVKSAPKPAAKNTTVMNEISRKKIPPALHPLCVPIDSITLDPANVRLHPPEQVTAIARSIELFGFRAVVNVRSDGKVCESGEGRILGARQLGLSHVPVVEHDDSEHTSRAFAVADNRTFDLGEYDTKRLAQQLNDLVSPLPSNEGLTTVFSPDDLGFATDDFNKLMSRLNVVPPPSFKSMDSETIKTDYACPKCRYEWSGKPKPNAVDDDGAEDGE